MQHTIAVPVVVHPHEVTDALAHLFVGVACALGSIHIVLPLAVAVAVLFGRDLHSPP